MFPERLAGRPAHHKEALVDALRREYPHYEFTAVQGSPLGDEDGFGIVPVVGVVGEVAGTDADEVYMRKPLDPLVIPSLVRSLVALEGQGLLVN
jgi:hypothetical protein